MLYVQLFRNFIVDIIFFFKLKILISSDVKNLAENFFISMHYHITKVYRKAFWDFYSSYKKESCDNFLNTVMYLKLCYLKFMNKLINFSTFLIKPYKNYVMLRVTWNTCYIISITAPIYTKVDMNYRVFFFHITP